MRGPVRARRRETGEAASEHARVCLCVKRRNSFISQMHRSEHCSPTAIGQEPSVQVNMNTLTCAYTPNQVSVFIRIPTVC